MLVSFFPANWLDLAASTGALKGLRKDKSPENLLRTLLIHLGCGHSLRETVVRARQASLADLSDVACSKRLRKSREWLYALCVELFREHGSRFPRTPASKCGRSMRRPYGQFGPFGFNGGYYYVRIGYTFGNIF